MSLLGLTCVVAVACWLLLTAFAQFRSVLSRLSRFDVFRLIPTWTFFAPNPGVVDYHLVVRDKSSNGVLSAWREVQIGQERNFVNFIWNPQKRPKKVMIDAVQSLTIILTRGEAPLGQEIISLPYLLLLHISGTVPDALHEVVSRQFAIFQTSGHRDKEIQLVYLSQFHGRIAD